MEIGLRILATIIDCVICFYSMPLLFIVGGWIIERSGAVGLFLVPVFFVLFFVWPFLYFGVFTGLWGKTPGKFICRLSVVYGSEDKPGLWRGLGRETLKLFAIGSSFGAIFALYQVLTQGTSWYDSMCGTQVQFKPYRRLTKTQKNYRQYMKEQERDRHIEK